MFQAACAVGFALRFLTKNKTGAAVVICKKTLLNQI